jgi:hypothetical protein
MGDPFAIEDCAGIGFPNFWIVGTEFLKNATALGATNVDCTQTIVGTVLPAHLLHTDFDCHKWLLKLT